MSLEEYIRIADYAKSALCQINGNALPVIARQMHAGGRPGRGQGFRRTRLPRLHLHVQQMRSLCDSRELPATLSPILYTFLRLTPRYSIDIQEQWSHIWRHPWLHGSTLKEMRVALTDVKLRNAKGRERPYKLSDRGGMFAEVLPSGTVVFRYQYRLNGKREKVTIGQYPDVSLSKARERHAEYRALVADGKSPALDKQHKKALDVDADTLEDFAKHWLKKNDSRPTWRACQEQWLDRDIYPALGKRKLAEIEPRHILALLDRIQDRGAKHSAMRVRGILSQIFKYAISRQKVKANPVRDIPASDYCNPEARDRTLDPAEIRRFLQALDAGGAEEQNKIALRLLLLTLARKSELRLAQWAHVDLDRAVWEIPAEHMKMKRPHVVYLSQQAVDLFRRLKKIARDSPLVLPGAKNRNQPCGQPTLNAVLYAIEHAALRKQEEWTRFTVHDLRRTASTLLHEAGFRPDVIEKCLAHEIKGVRGVYNRAEYADQRREMLQQWADMVDEFERGSKVIPLRRHAA